MNSPRLSHLDALEAESIQILREVAAEFSRPAMLYSIGKDSSVMLRAAQNQSPSRRAQGARNRRRHRRGAPRRGKVAGQRAHLLFSRRVRPVGPEKPET